MVDVVDSKGQMLSQSGDSRDRRTTGAKRTQSTDSKHHQHWHQQQKPHKNPTPNRKKQKAGSRAKHRLRSIYRDTRAMQDVLRQSNGQPMAQSLTTYALQHWKMVPNERCGSWYVSLPSSNSLCQGLPSSCYFKSTDGHRNFWDFSLKRLNLALLEQIIVADGGCILVDSSVRKLLPDSFSKTIPIWATVLNNFVLKYSKQLDGSEDVPKHWDTDLYTPKGVVSIQEHDQIAGLIEERVETLLRSGAIVNPKRLLEKLTKPLRVFWMNHEGEIYGSNGEKHDSGDIDHRKQAGSVADLLEKYFVVVCWNPSRYSRKPSETANGETSHLSSSDPVQNEVIALKKHQTEWIAENNDDDAETSSGYYYTPGAADDHECWAKCLIPALFWKNQEALLDLALDDNQVDMLIDVLVKQEQQAKELRESQHRIENEESCAHSHGSSSENKEAMATVYSYSDKIGETNLWIGSRRASRPSECWSGFDAILNVTCHEYDGMIEKNDATLHSREKKNNRFYLQLPVEEGKRDRSQLEKWMPVGLAFLIHHLQEGRRVLVHCAQGKDRSVAVALVFVTMVCPLRFPLRLKPEFTSRSWDLSTLANNIGKSDSSSSNDLKKRVADSDNNEKAKEAFPEVKTQFCLSSGLPETAMRRLLDSGGKELFLLWIHQQLQNDKSGGTFSNPKALKCLADKEGVRIALHLIKQDREVAEPTRSTMQKINRFLMSSSIYRCESN